MAPAHADNLPTDGSDGSQGGSGGRLNMLLSYGGWREGDSWADRLPALLTPFGVRTRRVSSGVEAAQVLGSDECFHLAVVDLRLPMDERCVCREDVYLAQEGGRRLLDLLARTEEPPPTIVVQATKSRRDEARDLSAALRRGVFAVIDRPVDLEIMLETFRRVLRRHYKDQWPAAQQ